MQGASASPVLSLSPSSPSFSSYSSANLAEIAARVVEEFRQQEPEDSEDIFNINWERPQEEEEEGRGGSNFDDDVALFSQQKHEEEEEEEEEFEFAVVCNKKQECSSITADEIFFNGQIRPLYPLFNRDLLLHDYDQNDAAAPSPAPVASPTTTTTTGKSGNRLPLGKLMSEERETSVSCSCSSSEADDLDNLPPGTYCVWTPKPSKESQSPGRSCKKSHSTGSSKRWKFRDLLYRSNSDGKDTFVFFTPLVTGNHHNKKTTAAARHRHHRRQDSQDYNKSSSGSATGTGKAVNKAAVNKEHYVRNRSVKEEDKKRSFLPYRQDLVGFFSNVNM